LSEDMSVSFGHFAAADPLVLSVCYFYFM
jgi:hypothetical protein